MTTRLHRVDPRPATEPHRPARPPGRSLRNPPPLSGLLPLPDPPPREPEAPPPPEARDEPDDQPEPPVVVETSGLCQRYGEKTALQDIDVQLRAGRVLGVLGHNGAGKTTLVRALCGLLTPSEGTVRVAGVDVTEDPFAVRRLLGVVNQQVAVDESMSGLATLVMVGRLLGASKAEARERAAELVEEFDLVEHAERPAAQWSGGLRRRLDLACAMVGRPEVLLLDEPTTGLDPISRETLWDVVDRRVRDGVAVVLTTQYLAEADRLADRLLVLVHGKPVVEGTPDELKARFASRQALFTVAPELIEPVMAAWHRAGVTPGFDMLTGKLSVPLEQGTSVLAVVRFLDRLGVQPTSLDVAEPTLDDVYRELHRADTEAKAQAKSEAQAKAEKNTRVEPVSGGRAARRAVGRGGDRG